MNIKSMIVVLALILIGAATVSASKESVQSSMDVLKDQVSAMASVSSDSYSYAAVSAIAGDNSEVTVYAEGEGSWLTIISSIYMETDNPVEGIGYAYVSGDEASSGSEASADSSGYYNSISIQTFLEGIGNAQGNTCIYGWEKSC